MTMKRIGDRMAEPAGEARVAAQADVVVVGGGPAGMSAAIAAARSGAKVTLLERYNHLGGLASGGMVLVLDDMWDLSLIHISEPTRLLSISYAVFCLKKK